MKETIARTFRITEETAEKLKSICADFGNQNTALESLINSYEVQNAATALTDRQTDIADYNSHIQALQAAFLHSLEITENTESRIRAEFQKQLESKDSIIISLQESLKQAETVAQVADERATAAETNAQAEIEQQAAIIADLQMELESVSQKVAEQAETLKADKGIIANQEELITDLREKAEIPQKIIDKIEEAKVRTLTAEGKVKELQKEIEALNQKLVDEKNAADQAAALAADRAEIALQKAVLAEQKAATESAKVAAEETKALYAEISKLKDEIRELKESKQKNQNSSNADSTN